MKKLDQPKKRWNAPVTLALAVVIILAASVFGLGFWLGVSSLGEPAGKISGPAFDRADYKIMSEPMPKELP